MPTRNSSRRSSISEDPQRGYALPAETTIEQQLQYNWDRKVNPSSADANLNNALNSRRSPGNNSARDENERKRNIVDTNVAKSRGYDRPEIETKSGKIVKDTDATDDWDGFLGPDQTNIDPRDGLLDPDRIWSKDGKRSIRYGDHEMGSTPNKHHYHRETWHDDKVENVLQRVQRTKKK